MLIHEAIEFAAVKHRNQVRKGTDTPYIVHPMEVMYILAENGCDETVVARAAIADTPLLIMDEATSSIDTRTEKIVQQGTDKLMEGRTTFVIAHRLSTVQSSDDIIVLDHGTIIEEGSHDELIAAKGQYYRLYTGAFELE